MFVWIFPTVAALSFFTYRAFNALFNKKAKPSVEKGEEVLTCDSIPLANKWPLGIDLLTRTLVASDELCVMEFFLDNFRKFGNTFRQVVGWSESLMTIDSAVIEAVLMTNAKDWGLGFRRIIFSPLLGDSIFIQEGSAWKHSRDILRPHFYHRNYESLDILRPHIDNLLQVMTSTTTTTDIIDLEPLFFHLTLDLTTEFLFGESVGSQSLGASTESREFEEAFNVAQSVSAKRLRFQKFHWLVGGKKLRNACNIIHRFVDRIIHKALATSVDEKNSGRPPFLRNIAQYYPGRDTLRGHTISILTAGRDTTAAFLSWTFFHLLRHPSVIAKLQLEISQVDETVNPLTRADLLRLSYLQNVIKEVLRLHPPLPLISRTALRDTILPAGGPDGRSPVLIPKGTSVLYSSYCIHRRPDIYGMDAELFRPERWDEEPLCSRETTHRGWTYLPFGGGPRTCLGMDFSLTGGAYTIVRILQRFPSIKLPVGERIQVSGKEKQITTLSLKPADGCKVDLGKV